MSDKISKSFTQWSNTRLGNHWTRYVTGFNFRTIIFSCSHINDLINNLKSNVKLFADDTSLFSEICNLLETANVLKMTRKICEWAKQWKMVFNPALSKQVKEVIFFWISHSLKYSYLYFNNLLVEKVKTQKHLELKLGKTEF